MPYDNRNNDNFVTWQITFREIWNNLTQTETLKPDHENPSTRILENKNQKSGKKRGWREKTKTSQKRVEQAPRVAASSMFAPQR
jgi:hypothetical protein